MSLVYQKITDLKTWRKYAPPKSPEKQWKCTRSAMELARYVTKALPDIPEVFKRALEYAGEQTESKEYTWSPEFVTKLPGKGEGRNHDLLLSGENIVVGVEAKVDEAFGNDCLEEWYAYGKTHNADKGENRLLRLNELCKVVFQKEYDQKNYSGIRYQLLSALAGTIIEAENEKRKKAMLLIVSFYAQSTSKRKTFKEENIQENNAAFNDFVGLIGARGISNESNKLNCPEIEFAGQARIGETETYIVKASVKYDLDCNECTYCEECKNKNKRLS